MRSGVDRAGNKTIGGALVDHHGAEIGGVLHTIARLIHTDALFLAQFKVGFHIVFEIGGQFGLDDANLFHVQAKGPDLRADFVRIAQQSKIRYVALEQNLGGAQDAFFFAFGQNDMHAVLAGLFHNLELEHARRHAL